MNKPVHLVVEDVPEGVFTAREYSALMNAGAFSDLRVELVKGQLRKMMPSGFSHGELNAARISMRRSCT